LGQAYAGLHLYSEAAREYRQATKFKTDDADIYYDLGTALTKLAQYDEAAAAFSKSLEIDPENYRAQDALEEAREGVKRITAGKKHQEELLKKQKEDELKKAEGETPGSVPSKPESFRRAQLPGVRRAQHPRRSHYRRVRRRNSMATYTPPPYFPQGSLAPPDQNRYKKFKAVMVLAVFLLLILLGGMVVGAWYLLKWMF